MSLQPYQDGSQSLSLYTAPQITAEEIEKRQKEAEELDKKLRHIIEVVPNRDDDVRGSMAGAGSSEFHKYRHSRRREQDRLKKIDEDAELAEIEKARQERSMQIKQLEEEKTAKRRAKRQKKKEKQQKNKKLKGSGDVASHKDHAGSDEHNTDEEEEEPIQQPDLD